MPSYGGIIDSNLEFDKHINAKINKANSMAYILKILSPYKINRNILMPWKMYRYE